MLHNLVTESFWLVLWNKSLQHFNITFHGVMLTITSFHAAPNCWHMIALDRTLFVRYARMLTEPKSIMQNSDASAFKLMHGMCNASTVFTVFIGQMLGDLNLLFYNLWVKGLYKCKQAIDVFIAMQITICIQNTFLRSLKK